MPLVDTSIPLSGRPMAAPPDPMAQRTQMVQLADLINRTKMQQQMAPLQMQNLQAETEARQLQVQAAKRQQALLESDTAAYHDAVEEAGGNYDKLPKTKAWMRMSPQTAFGIQKEINDAAESHAKRTKAEIDVDKAHDEEVLGAFGNVASQPQLVDAVNRLVKGGHLPPEEGAQIVREGYSEETMRRLNTRGLTSAMISNQAIKLQELANAKATGREISARATKLEYEAEALKNPPTADRYSAAIDAIAAPSKDDKETQRAAAAAKAQISSILSFGGPEARKKADTAMDKFTDDLAAMGRTKAGADWKSIISLGGLTDEDLMREGETAARTGTSPSMGMGNMAVRNKIMHYKNEWARQHGYSPADLLNLQMEFNSGKVSYTNLLKAYDQVSNYEVTARGNLDRALGAATKIVDTGNPVFNLPLREAAKRLAGSPQQAAFNTALLTARNEVARILNASPTTMGGVISDEARKDVDEIMAKDYSLAQLISAANILKADLTQRTSSMKNQLDLRKSEATGSEKAAGQAAQSQAASAAATANTGMGGPTPATAPAKKRFSKSRYLKAHPGADMAAVIAAAQAQGYEVIE